MSPRRGTKPTPEQVDTRAALAEQQRIDWLSRAIRNDRIRKVAQDNPTLSFSALCERFGRSTPFEIVEIIGGVGSARQFSAEQVYRTAKGVQARFDLGWRREARP